MESYALHQGVASVYRLLDATNEYLAERAPWTLAKDPANAAALDEVLFTAAESVRLPRLTCVPLFARPTCEVFGSTTRLRVITPASRSLATALS